MIKIYGLIFLAFSAVFAPTTVWWWIFSGSLVPLVPRVQGVSGVFELQQALPRARTEAGGVVCGDTMFVVGGLGPRAQSYADVAAYDLHAQTWAEIAPLPIPVHHPGVVCANDELYVIGGFGPLGIRIHGIMLARWYPLDSVFRYDAGSQIWHEERSLPQARGAGGVAVAEGAIWYVGGINPERNISNSLFRYNLQTHSWTEQPAMRSARDHLRLEAVGGFLFAVSGREDDMRHNLADVERYDISQRSWTRVADIPVARGGFGSAVINGYIYTFGGEGVWSCYDTVERYDPVADVWTTLDGLPEARHGIVAGVHDRHVHLVSGGRHARISISGIHRVFYPKASAVWNDS